MKHKQSEIPSSGFALPTVLIASIVMLIVLLSGLVAASSTNTALRQQYYNRITNEAVDSGIIMAKACIAKTGTPQWSDASPLRPDSGCSGSSAACAASTCYLVNQSNIKTTFTVGAPTLNSDGSYMISSTGSISQYRTSTSTIVSTSSTTYQSKVYTGWKQVSLGESFGCGISLTDNLYCWGKNDFLQRGSGDTSTTSTAYDPSPVYTGGVLAGKTVIKVSTSNYSACALTSDGLVDCWGNNTGGELGNGTQTNSSVPVQVGGLLAGKTATDVSIGFGQACAIANGDAYCWGALQNPVGVLGNNTFSGSSTPVAVYKSGVLAGLTIKKIAVDHSNACVIASNNLAYCWGSSNNGALGNNQSSADSSVPVAVYTAGVLAGKTIKAISMWYGYTCTIASDDKAYCWGDNGYGQLGNNSSTYSQVPVAVNTAGVLSGKVVTDIFAGKLSTCAIASGAAYCWGENSVGTLGNNSTATSLVPVAVNTTGVLSGKTLSKITVTFGPACALSAIDNRFYCWGSNYQAYFGTRQPNSTLVPVVGGAVPRGLSY
jgi:alpha-tubulin suppressor-like RCC1 family protein